MFDAPYVFSTFVTYLLIYYCMKLLWLDLNSSYAHSSLALPALQAQMLDNHTIEWDILSATINENPGTIVCEIQRRNPDVIAATNWLFTHEALLHILSRAAVLLPQTQIILGGPEFLGENETFLRHNTFVTAVFRGEGEEGFKQWCDQRMHPQKWGDITGLCHIDDQGVYHDNGLARVMKFDELVSPQESPFFNWDKPFVQLETTRGCFNTCAFCVSGGEKPVRNLSLDQIHQRLQQIHEKGIKNVRVLDRTFNYNMRHAKGLLNLFKLYSPHICFHLEMHPALLTDELKRELAACPDGLLHLEAGIQSLRQSVLDASCRKGKVDAALEGLKFLCGLSQMETHTDLIAGLPLYSLEALFEDVQVLAALNAGEIQLESLKLLPGTEMRRRAEELGLLYSPYPPYEVLQTNEITAAQLQTARLLSRLLDAFYNAKAWQGVMKHLIVNEAEFLKAFLEHLTLNNQIDQPMSMERRGVILYDFVKENYPTYLQEVTLAWIEAGLSLKKAPAEQVKTKRQTPPQHWEVAYGSYKEGMRLCFLPIDAAQEHGYWFGFDNESQLHKPIFRALA